MLDCTFIHRHGRWPMAHFDHEGTVLSVVYNKSHLSSTYYEAKIIICCFDKQKEKMFGTQSLIIYPKEDSQ